MGEYTNQISKLEETIERLQVEKQNKLDIIEALHDSVIVFEANLKAKHVNTQAKALLSITNDFDPYKEDTPFFKNRKATLSFKLANWLDCIKEDRQLIPKETKVWFRHPKHLNSKPMLLSARVLLDNKGQVTQVLLVIYDQSINDKALGQKRLFQAAFNGFNEQFITNEKGFIIEANDAFLKLSGMNKKQLKKLTILKWLEQSVEWDHSAESFINVVLQERYWSGEVEIFTQLETRIQAAMSISMIMDSDNSLEYFIVNIQNISDIKEAHQQIEHMALYDGLTSLPNRKLITQHINKIISQNRVNKCFGTILNINLDRFKSINDAFGRMTGDRFLKRIATTIKSLLDDRDQLSRLGGDEFVVVVQNNGETAEKAIRKSLLLANRILLALNQHFLVDSLTLNTSARIGMVAFPDSPQDTAENLLIKTDLAVSEAKHVTDKCKTYVYQSTLTREAKLKRQLENDLSHAIIREELTLFFQAKVDEQEKVVGAETLLRWQHPQKGFISPYTFIPIAEESRQIIPIGNWVMQQAFIQAKRWSKKHPKFNLSVNISPIQFHEADFILHVKEALDLTAVNPKNLTLELTENVFISNNEATFEKISALDELGIKVSIDDFGTGYSSLSYFQKLPIHELKIDKSFVDRVPQNREEVAIIESIIHLASTKQLAIVAEGVETKQQKTFLHKKNPHILIQGFYYSKPCPSSLFEQQFLEIK